MTGPGTSVTRWLLLCALAFCVVGTHHLGLSGHHEHRGPAPVVPSAAAPVTTTVDSPAPEGDGAEALLHLCLAMLASVAVFGALLVRRRVVRRGPAPTARHRAVHRSPPRALPLRSPVALRL